MNLGRRNIDLPLALHYPCSVYYAVDVISLIFHIFPPVLIKVIMSLLYRTIWTYALSIVFQSSSSPCSLSIWYLSTLQLLLWASGSLKLASSFDESDCLFRQLLSCVSIYLFLSISQKHFKEGYSLWKLELTGGSLHLTCSRGVYLTFY